MSLIDNYLKPSNMRAFILDKRLGETGTQSEPRYNIKYKRRPLDPNILRRWEQSFSHGNEALSTALQEQRLSLPGPNPFISRSLVLESKGQLEEPLSPTRMAYELGHLCSPTEPMQHSGVSLAPVKCNIFHKQDNKFKVPKTAVSLNFYFKPKSGDSVQHYIMTGLYVRLAGFAITEVS